MKFSFIRMNHFYVRLDNTKPSFVDIENDLLLILNIK